VESLKNRKSHKHLIEKLRRKVMELERQNWKIEFNWIKARAGHQGNEMIDELAKEAATNSDINPLNPNDPYRGRTAPLTSKRCILYIYSTNIGTIYFKHGIYSFFFLFKMQFFS
jgi:hypothetical protein